MSTAKSENGQSLEQSEVLSALEALRERVFDSSNEKLALALGKPVEEIEAWFNRTAPMDDDAIMKARGLVHERLDETQ